MAGYNDTGDRSTRPRGTSTWRNCTRTGWADPLCRQGHRIPEPHGPPRLRSHEHDLERVELPPVAAQPPHRQQALVAVAEGHERAGPDEPDALALELRPPARLEQRALEQEAARHVVRRALDRRRVALAPRAPLPRAVHR